MDGNFSINLIRGDAEISLNVEDIIVVVSSVASRDTTEDNT